jgi:RNA polymerase sigma-70 factor (ECF subfamily)
MCVKVPFFPGFLETRELSFPYLRYTIVETVIITDMELIEQCHQGQQSSFGELMTRYQNRVFQMIYRLNGNHEESTDILQETFIKAYRKLHTFRKDTSFSAWLFRIAYNETMDNFRERKKHAGISMNQLSQEVGYEPVDTNMSQAPSHQMETAETQELVQAALQELSEEYRTVIILKEIEDLSYEEISAITASPIGTVRSRLHRGRLEFRELLNRHLTRQNSDHQHSNNHTPIHVANLNNSVTHNKVTISNTNVSSHETT